MYYVKRILDRKVVLSERLTDWDDKIKEKMEKKMEREEKKEEEKLKVRSGTKKISHTFLAQFGLVYYHEIIEIYKVQSANLKYTEYLWLSLNVAFQWQSLAVPTSICYLSLTKECTLWAALSERYTLLAPS